MNLRYAYTLALCALVSVFGFSNVAAQEEPNSSKSVLLESAQIEALISELASRTDLSEGSRASALELYNLANNYLLSDAQHRQRRQAFLEQIESMPAQLAAIRTTLRRTLEEEIANLAEPNTSTSLPELESQLLQVQTAESSKAKDVQRLEQELRAARERPDQIRQALSALQDQLRVFANENDNTSRPAEPEVVGAARRVFVQARTASTLSQQEMLEQELLTHDSRMQLISAKLDRARRDLSLTEASRVALEQRVSGARLTAAETAQTQATNARIAAIGKHPLVAAMAEYNTRLSAELTRSTESRAQLNVQLASAKQLAEQIEHDFRVTQQRIEIAGLSESLGQSLAKVRNDLPDFARYEKEVAGRQSVLQQTALALLRVSERRRSVSEFERRFEQVLSRTRENLSDEQLRVVYDALKDLDGGESFVGVLDEVSSLSAEQRIRLRKALATLRRDQQQLLDKLDSSYAESLRILSDVDFTQRQLVDRAQAFVKFIDRHLLWTPSSPVLDLDVLRGVPGAFDYLISAENWSALFKVLYAEVRHVPVRAVLACLIVVLLATFRQKLRRRLSTLGQINRYPYVHGFGVTLQALVVSALITVIWPLLLAFIGQRLRSASASPEFVTAFGEALFQSAWFLLFSFGFRVLCANDGVALEQFKWSARSVALWRKNLRWFMPLGVVCILVVVTLDGQSNRAHVESLGRVAFLVFVIASAVFLYRLLDPTSGLIADKIQRGDSGWLVRLRYVWYLVLIGGPLCLIGLTAMGYFYSAGVLAEAAYSTVWLLIGARIVSDLVERWLIVTRRRREWEELSASQPAVHTNDVVGEGVPVTPIEDPGLDLQTINAQAKRLLNAALVVIVAVGLVIIWVDISPAISVLEDIVLWRYATEVDGVTALLPITLTDVTLALLIALGIAVAASNIPGLLEIAVLQRLPMEPSVRYAITSVGQYLIVAIGIIVVFNTLGIGWGQVQWLAAALTVGLGFGLQEVFANFVSGLIILFERPIRVGDTVTIGGVTGTVTRIRTRATTIADWDNKEIVVPNKTFITDQLTNWTLSDPIIRVVMQVGIAYGSDTALAHRVMLETAQANPMVLQDPAPSVYFLGLGDSSLNFDVRVYVKDLGDWLPVAHEFHMTVVKALSDHGVEIPFPQRDLHIRSSQPLVAT